jgi:non-ribosomal peptide synthetase component E (peptide arylation enzyme)
MFGMGEGLCMVSSREAPAAIRHGTQGTPVSAHDEVRVYEPGTESPVPPGQPGELCVRGPYTICGYYAAPGRNAEAFTSDGFYRTGDVVTEIQDAGRGYYRLEDRIKDLINRGGEKINAEEVEQLLLDHPGIERAAVVAMPDDRLGEKACAFLVLRPGVETIDLEVIKAHLHTRGVAKFKWPERLEIRSELPLTNIHKVNKAILRQQIAAIVTSDDLATT